MLGCILPPSMPNTMALVVPFTTPGYSQPAFTFVSTQPHHHKTRRHPHPRFLPVHLRSHPHHHHRLLHPRHRRLRIRFTWCCDVSTYADGDDRSLSSGCHQSHPHHFHNRNVSPDYPTISTLSTAFS